MRASFGLLFGVKTGGDTKIVGAGLFLDLPWPHPEGHWLDNLRDLLAKQIDVTAERVESLRTRMAILDARRSDAGCA